MQEPENILDAYNKTAKNYADKFLDELTRKPFDTMLLKCFAEENKSSGTLLDLGCGPGQTTKFLHDNGVINILGTDISPEMIKIAGEKFPLIKFEVADMLNLSYPNETFGSAIAFYSIIHFDYGQIESFLSGAYRVLKPNAQFLLAFHVGNEIIQLNDFLGHSVNLKAHFIDPQKIIAITQRLGFETRDVMERMPYQDVEYPSRRAYIWLKK